MPLFCFGGGRITDQKVCNRPSLDNSNTSSQLMKTKVRRKLETFLKKKKKKMLKNVHAFKWEKLTKNAVLTPPK